MEFRTKCLIIGSGPAGYTAGIYTSRAGLAPIMIEGPQPGGQLITTTEIENFPGFVDGVKGPKMMEDFRSQAERFGLQIITGMVTDVDFSSRPYKAVVDGGASTVLAESVIISTGASAKYLGLDDEQKYLGMGVSACATCDGFFFRNRTVAVVGGGDTACEEALYLAGLASKVYMIVRKDHLRASQYMQRRVMENPKIEILFDTVTLGLFGQDVLEGARLRTSPSTALPKEYEIALDGFFLAIGHKPNTDLF
ncbi:MAG: FAD-dependent oxidoreductase, partial [Muribaculaceae bacterium]|nr:FAD-dependent oxidoreductase [Muribaculaceae bacterium]